MNLTNRAFDALAPGASFVLVADHDPISLGYMLDAERPGMVTWQPLEHGPATWRVRVTKVPTPTRH
jgi:regulator of cell morphogenesis and NO signaling